MQTRNQNHSDERSIIHAVQQGDQRAYQELVETYQHKIFSLAMRLLHNKQEAEEAAQDAFVKAYFSISSFRGEAKFSTWLYRIAYNTALNRRKNVHADDPVDDSDTILDSLEHSTNHVQTSLERSELSSVIEQFLTTLPIQYSSVLTLFYLDDLSYEEIAKITGMSLSTVKVKLFRARAALKKKIAKHQYFEEYQA